MLYKEQKPLEAKKFKIQCGYGGFFKPPSDGWPLCDSVEPEKCSDYPQNVPDIVEIVKEEPQLPGGKIYYKCKEEGFVTNIGDLAAVCEITQVSSTLTRGEKSFQPRFFEGTILKVEQPRKKYLHITYFRK